MTGTVTRRVTRRLGAEAAEVDDALACEEPLEIRLGDRPVAVVMRTPGHDVELALGFLFTEGILRSPDQVLSARHCQDVTADAAGNVVTVLADGADEAALGAAQRQTYASSSCGLCGKTTLAAVRLKAPPLIPARPPISLLASMPERLRAGQTWFHATGGHHAAALVTLDGELLALREDVGRHNAVDKVLGAQVQRERWPLPGTVLALSGRASFEMVQKAAMAGIPAVAAISAPSSLAVDYAREAGMLLVGFVRDGGMNVYAGEVG